REVEDVDGAFSSNLATKPDHDGRLQMRDFNVAFEKLSDEQKEALILVGASGFSYEEAAQTCGVAVGTIKSRVNRARVRLAELLNIDEDEAMEATDMVTSAIVSGNQSAA
ncbi:MAG: sigma factor-like helix-turn-helix DNA-binding protein, partial [Shimia sp.]